MNTPNNISMIPIYPDMVNWSLKSKAPTVTVIRKLMAVINGITDENDDRESALIEKNIEKKMKIRATRILVSIKKCIKSSKPAILLDNNLCLIIAAPVTLHIAYSKLNNATL